MSQFLKKNGTWLGLILLMVILTIWTQGDFLSSRNITNLVRQASINGILAAGMTIIIITGGIDLSIGSLVALCGVLVGISQVNWQWSQWGHMGLVYSGLLSVFVGLLFGLINGGLIAKLKIAPFVITLGMMVITRGLALIFSDGASISPMGDALTELASGYYATFSSAILVVLFLALMVWSARSTHQKIEMKDLIFPVLITTLIVFSFFHYKGFPHLALFLGLVIAGTWFLLQKTVLGRSVYAIGSNEKAAYWAGVNIPKVVLLSYGLMGLLSGLAAVLLTGRLNGADPNAGQLFELDAIAAVVIGGTSLKGGSGSVIGSLIGALMIATLNNGMDLMGVTSFYQMVFKGLIIVLAVSLDRR